MNNFFEQQVNESLKNPKYAKAYYLATGEIETVDKIVNYLQHQLEIDKKQQESTPGCWDAYPYLGLQKAIDLIINRKWDPEWEGFENE